MSAQGTIRARLEADARTAMKARDKTALSAIRTLIAAIDNAGAVAPGPAGPPVVNERADLPRRELSEDDVRGVLKREAREMQTALAEYEALGRTAEMEELRAKLALADSYIAL